MLKYEFVYIKMFPVFLVATNKLLFSWFYLSGPTVVLYLKLKWRFITIYFFVIFISLFIELQVSIYVLSVFLTYDMLAFYSFTRMEILNY
jgi:hypothetical protein